MRNNRRACTSGIPERPINGGTRLVVNPRTHTVFAMVRNDRGPDYSKHLSKVMSLVRDATGDRRVKRTHFGVEIGPTL